MKTLAALFVLGLATTGSAGTPEPKAPPKAELERPEAKQPKPAEGKALCTFVNPDQNAPSERGDCIAVREPDAPRGADKQPPAAPNEGAQPSSR